MPARTNAFQSLVKAIEVALNNKTWKITESAMLEDKTTGNACEVDILVQGTVGGHEIRIAFECRDHARPQNREWIDSLVGKFKNVGVNKVVAVSSGGFTKAAIEKAYIEGIEVLSFTDALGIRWEKFVGRFEITVGHQSSQFVGMKIALRNPSEGLPVDEKLEHLEVVSKGKKFGKLEDCLASTVNLAALKQEIELRTKPEKPENGQVHHNFEIKITTNDWDVIDSLGKIHPIESITLMVQTRTIFVSKPAKMFTYNDNQIVHGNLQVHNKTFAVTLLNESPDGPSKVIQAIAEENPVRKAWKPKRK